MTLGPDTRLFDICDRFLTEAVACIPPGLVDGDIRSLVSLGEPEGCCDPVQVAAWGEVEPDLPQGPGCFVPSFAVVNVSVDTCMPVWDQASAPPLELLEDPTRFSYQLGYLVWYGLMHARSTGAFGACTDTEPGPLVHTVPEGGCARWTTTWRVDLSVDLT